MASQKKVENHAHSVALFAMYYNFVRIHNTLRTAPAMAANITQSGFGKSVILWMCSKHEKHAISRGEFSGFETPNEGDVGSLSCRCRTRKARLHCISNVSKRLGRGP